MATGAACARRSRDSDGGAGADVSGRVTVRYEDVEASARALVVRCVGEKRLSALT